MARRPRPTRKAFERLLDSLAPDMVQAFEEAIQRIKDEASARRIEELIESGRIDLVIEELGLGPEDFALVREAYENAFTRGGKYEAQFHASAGPFDRRHPKAEAAMRERGARAVTNISVESRLAVHNFLQEGIESGKNTKTLTQELVGKRNRRTGRREGGVIGLTDAQRRFVYGGTNPQTGRQVFGAVDELSRPGGPGANYLTRRARNRKFDPLVKKAIREGTTLSAIDRDRILKDYEDGLRRYRANTIARTESHTALNDGRYEAMRQNAERAGVDESAIVVKWQSIGDGRTRGSHAAENGQTVKYGEPFVLSSGARLMFPGDTSLGASASETINCRCTTTFEIDLGLD